MNSARPFSAAPAPPDPPDEKFHFAVARATFPNGLRVCLMERPRLPILSLTVMVQAGVISEGAEEAGLSAFTLNLLPRGTVRRDALRLAEEVDSMGASLGVHGDYDFSMVGISSLARDQDEAIEILAEVVTAPAFLPEEVERRRHDILSNLERLKDDPGELVRNRFLRAIYGAHPYHLPSSGLPETVRGFAGPQLRSFYNRLYRPNNAVLAVVGDLKPESMMRILQQRFGCWARAEIVRPELPAIPVPRQRTLRRIHKDGMTQATLRVGGIGIRRDNPDYVPLVLMNYILGGSGFGSRLMKSLREDSGLTYGAYSNFHPRREQGYFFASCQTGLATMNDSLEKMLEEIGRLRDGGVSAEELEWAQRYFLGSLPLSLQTNDHLATRVLEQEFFGLEEEYWLRDVERMRKITVAEINAAAHRYLDPDLLSIVCLADFHEVELRPGFGVEVED